MNVRTFLDHWQLSENPFRAEEARHDPVFARLGTGDTDHPDFEKILGDLDRPSTAIVFGEKGSGKTAIRLQLERRIRDHNQAAPDGRILLIAHDDLNPMLDRIALRLGVDEASDEKEVLRALRKIRIVDHMDGILHLAVIRLVDTILGTDADPVLPADEAVNALRRDPQARRNIMLLQALYDRDENAGARTGRLRRLIRASGNPMRVLHKALLFVGWVPAAAFFIWAVFWLAATPSEPPQWSMYVFGALLACWLVIIGAWLLGKGRLRMLARRLSRRLRSVGRTPEQLAASLSRMPPEDRRPEALPVDTGDGRRYEMFDRLRQVLGVLGCRGAVVVIDRVDEPTLVNGDAGRMRAIIWPLLNNKLLQQDGIGFKLLLPLELRHELFRETSDFFQEARLDKQNLVERLTWSGAMLYDLCSTRLNACRVEGAATLTDLFTADVTRQDLVDALDQMQQPRDAFKLLYQCIQEHCGNVTQEQEQWRIPRHVLDVVRRQQAERVQMFHRGVRPA
ncbi:MAG: hypothetical protein KDA21_00490, partial [Phycisphaerales bacterium]|nr:hypothetical protein [Phycisphaerales bacterium]